MSDYLLGKEFSLQKKCVSEWVSLSPTTSVAHSCHQVYALYSMMVEFKDISSGAEGETQHKRTIVIPSYTNCN